MGIRFGGNSDRVNSFDRAVATFKKELFKNDPSVDITAGIGRSTDIGRSLAPASRFCLQPRKMPTSTAGTFCEAEDREAEDKNARLKAFCEAVGIL